MFLLDESDLATALEKFARRGPFRQNPFVTRLGLVFRHIRALPLRTLMTVLAFSFSVGLLGFLLLLSEAFKKDFSPFTAQRVVVIGKGSFLEKLPLAYQARIEKMPGVLKVVAVDFFMAGRGDTRAENQVPVTAAPAAPLLFVYREANLPDEERDAWLADPTGAMVGPLLVKKYGWKLGERIILKAPVNGGVVVATVRAVMRYKLDSGVYIHRRYYEGLIGSDAEAMMYWVLAKTREDVQPLSLAIERELANAPAPIRAMTEKQWQLYFLQMIGNVKALIGGIGLATGFALLLITSNTLAMAARERRTEAALLRILGFQKREVAFFLLLEAGVYGLLGAIGGAGLMVLFSRTIGSALDGTQYAGLGSLLAPEPADFLLLLGLSLLLAAGAGLVPAFGLSRRSIVDLLRETT